MSKTKQVHTKIFYTMWIEYTTLANIVLLETSFKIDADGRVRVSSNIKSGHRT